MMIVAADGGGKTTILLWILTHTDTEMLLRAFYTEVIIICESLEKGYDRHESDDWSLFREVYGFGDNDVSHDGFF